MRRDYFTLGSPRWNEKAIFSPALYTILVFLFYIRLGCRAAVGDCLWCRENHRFQNSKQRPEKRKKGNEERKGKTKKEKKRNNQMVSYAESLLGRKQKQNNKKQEEVGMKIGKDFLLFHHVLLLYAFLV
jgi:hypothetical protein